jgi:hypothetical protein
MPQPSPESSFLIASCAVDLRGEEKTRQPANPGGCIKAARIDKLIFDCVSGPCDFTPLKASNASYEIELNFRRQ